MWKVSTLNVNVGVKYHYDELHCNNSIPHNSQQMKVMWSEYCRIFISILLSLAFMFMFGFENIQKYIEGGTTIIRDQVFSKHKDIPLPGRIVDFKMSSCTYIGIIISIHCGWYSKNGWTERSVQWSPWSYGLFGKWYKKNY